MNNDNSDLTWQDKFINKIERNITIIDKELDRSSHTERKSHFNEIVKAIANNESVIYGVS